MENGAFWVERDMDGQSRTAYVIGRKCAEGYFEEYVALMKKGRKRRNVTVTLYRRGEDGGMVFVKRWRRPVWKAKGGVLN